MKKIFAIIVASIALCACSDKKQTKTYLPLSEGEINKVVVVMQTQKWQGKIGEVIRETLAASYIGLPQDEPIFELQHIPPSALKDFEKQRTLIVFEDSDNKKASVNLTEDVFAKPQSVTKISGGNDDEIAALFKTKAPKIIAAFKTEHIKERQSTINLSPKDLASVEESLGFEIAIPSIYKVNVAKDNFFWLAKELTTYENMNFIFYEVSKDAIQKENLVMDLMQKRNQMTRDYILGEDGIVIKVNDAFAPAMFETTLGSYKAYEIRGLWRVEGSQMAGPFLTYAIDDKKNNRFLIVDGFTYAPSLKKRPLLFEIEAILKSVRLKK